MRGRKIKIYSLFLHDPVAGGGHAVNAHVCGPVLVTDCDGESPEVSSDDLNCLVSSTRDLQALPLALVSSLVSRPVWANSCNNREKLFYSSSKILYLVLHKGLEFSRENNLC